MNPLAQTGQRPEGDGDDEFLDAVFEAAVARLAGGGQVSAEEFVVHKPALAEQITEILALAQRMAAPGAVPARRALPTIAGFQILRELGRGGMGTVYVARQEPLGRTVALKVLQGAESLSSNARQRFLHEARVLARISHPHVVQVHQVVEQDGICAFAMELVEGRSLTEVITAVQGAPEAERLRLAAATLQADLERDRSWTGFVLRVGAEVAEALTHVHSQGLVHRDVKPSNILVRRDGKALLADFGLVRDQESQSLTGTGQFLGTLPYASPEQLRGKQDAVDARTDVYSLGVTLYQASTLRLPFSATSTARMLARIEAGAAPSLRQVDRGLPRDLELVVGKAMDPDPSRRYAGAAELAQDLRSVLELRPVRAQRASMVLRARRWVQRHPTWAPALLVGAILCGAAMLALQMKVRADARRAQIATDRLLVTGLLEEVPRLLPGGSQRIPAMAQWLSQAHAVQPRLVEHRQLRVELERRGAQPDAAATAAERDRQREREFESTRDRERVGRLRATINSSDISKVWSWPELCIWARRLEEQAVLRDEPDASTLLFADPEDQRLFATLQELQALGARLVAMEQKVALRLDATRRQEAVGREAMGNAWSEACRFASDQDHARHYAGLELTPQPDLVPLGPDPESGLQEFCHLWSGDVPVRDPATGRLQITAATGIVLVLLPGGTAKIGAELPPSGEADGVDHRDRAAHGEEQPPVMVALDPFFLSKFEMTQAQWLRVTGGNPSWFSIGQQVDGRTVNGLHPVESIAWIEAQRVLISLDLVLPTDAQWEYACRGGTATRYWTGADVATLQGAENLADAGSELRQGLTQDAVAAKTQQQANVAWDDGWLRHAPVGSFAPNRFGLFDMQGNVCEFCQECGPQETHYSLLPAREGDGLRTTPLASWVVVIRGASFLSGPWQARSSCRPVTLPDQGILCHGVRPARRLSR